MNNEQQRTAIAGRNLLLFDGLCGLCNGTVRFLHRRDRARRLVYVPLESPLGQELLDHAGIRRGGSYGSRLLPDGIVLFEDALLRGQVVTTRSDAVIRVLHLLRPPWPLAGWLLARIPRGMREAAYGLIARWRYRLFGTYETCPLLSTGDRDIVLVSGD